MFLSFSSDSTCFNNLRSAWDGFESLVLAPQPKPPIPAFVSTVPPPSKGKIWGGEWGPFYPCELKSLSPGGRFGSYAAVGAPGVTRTQLPFFVWSHGVARIVSLLAMISLLGCDLCSTLRLTFYSPRQANRSACRFPSWAEGQWEQLEVSGASLTFADAHEFKTFSVRCVGAPSGALYPVYTQSHWYVFS